MVKVGLTTVKNYTKENSHQKCFTVNTLMKEKKICFVPICIGIDIFFLHQKLLYL